MGRALIEIQFPPFNAGLAHEWRSPQFPDKDAFQGFSRILGIPVQGGEALMSWLRNIFGGGASKAQSSSLKAVSPTTIADEFGIFAGGDQCSWRSGIVWENFDGYVCRYVNGSCSGGEAAFKVIAECAPESICIVATDPTRICLRTKNSRRYATSTMPSGEIDLLIQLLKSVYKYRGHSNGCFVLDADERSASLAEEMHMHGEARGGVGLGPEIDSMVEDLLRIENFLPHGNPDPTAFAIGERLYTAGGVAMMKQACARVAAKRGSIASLSACWDGIGAKTGIIPGVNAWVD